ncbi:hypothetical protein EYC80_010631 [Monilinia laxa]|uniref:Uncharacterized protein n=1 Tax=Monilinia laxa TaxID=61186 RepID=A0A5N6JMY2_MONLA|nr:hypothetical protein EYC80_010631 [Monilinia laxa]
MNNIHPNFLRTCTCIVYSPENRSFLIHFNLILSLSSQRKVFLISKNVCTWITLKIYWVGILSRDTTYKHRVAKQS